MSVKRDGSVDFFHLQYHFSVVGKKISAVVVVTMTVMEFEGLYSGGQKNGEDEYLDEIMKTWQENRRKHVDAMMVARRTR